MGIFSKKRAAETSLDTQPVSDSGAVQPGAAAAPAANDGAMNPFEAPQSSAAMTHGE